jgi:hypothetical protein
MGENPKPTAIIALQGLDYSDATLTCTFSYSLNTMSGANYWGYGIKLEYGGTSGLGSSVTIQNTSPSQWSVTTGTVQIVKNGVTTSPQSFYFRLNALSSTAGTPGATGSYSVDFQLSATLAELTYFPSISVEKSWNIGYSLNGADHVGIKLYMWAKSRPESEKTLIYSEGHYDNRGVRIFSDDIIFSCYSLPNVQLSPSNPAYLQYELLSYDSSYSYVGSDFETVDAYFAGTSNVKADGIWENTIPYVKISGAWKSAIMYGNSGGTWKRCLPMN